MKMIAAAVLFLFLAIPATAASTDTNKGLLQTIWEEVDFKALDNVTPVTMFDLRGNTKLLGLTTTVVKYKYLFGDLGIVQSLDADKDNTPVLGIGFNAARYMKNKGLDLTSIIPKAKVFESMKLGVFASKRFDKGEWMYGPYIKFQLEFD